jgi:hypothetical protein
VATFTFYFQQITEEEGYQEETRQTDSRQLWIRLQQAKQWQEAAPGRTVSVEGRGLMREVLNPALYRYLLKELIPSLPEAQRPKPPGKQIIGLLWMDVHGMEELNGYKLFKVVRQHEHWSDFERSHVEHYLEEVDPTKWIDAIKHARKKLLWTDKGIWINRKPALLFSGQPDVALVSLLDIRDITSKLEPDLQGQIPFAPVRYSPNTMVYAYPWMRTTRDRGKIQRLGHAYPTAPEDKMWVPKELLIRRYGYHKPSRLSALDWVNA